MSAKVSLRNCIDQGPEKYSYNISPQIYTRTSEGNIIQSDTTQMIQKLLVSVMGADAASASWMTGWDEDSTYGQMYSASGMSSMMGGGMMTLWQELLPGENGAPVNASHFPVSLLQ